jgi:adenine-specific DNA-methyltransferase
MMTELSAVLMDSEKQKNENLIDYASRLSSLWVNYKSLEKRKAKAQFFTPKEISNFMANMITIKKTNFKLLDAGAGVGNLTAAFCNQLTKCPVKCSIFVDAYENDPELIPPLKSVLDACKKELKEYGHSMSYDVIEKDFVIYNKKVLEDQHSLDQFQTQSSYDYILSNPPYYKLERDSPQAIIMRKFISGHPNIYALFMILSAKMLNNNGELVFITPRSFCSGTYYKKFRNWFLQTVQIEHIHIFQSRKDIFSPDQVLQENILIKASKTSVCQDAIKISSSKSKAFDFFNEITVTKNDVIFHKNGDVFIRIPSSQRDVATLRLIDTWPKTLKDIGLEISTGPVVVFRTKENVCHRIENDNKFVPLIWMHNFDNTKINWPLKKKNKPPSICVNEITKPLLLPIKNYVLLGRFSFKEQRKRINVAVLLKDDFPFNFIGIENHVNYIHKLYGELTKEEAWGIATLLNTKLIDNYFRSLNGNTQVNAIDIRSLPLPNLEQIIDIGKKFLAERTSYIDWDEIVCSRNSPGGPCGRYQRR